MTALQHHLNINVDTDAKITDYKYSPNGSLLAVSNSEGKIIIHKKCDKNFKKIAQFVGDQASIWSIAWGNPKYGNVLAIGSFKNKVAIFQEINETWKEVAMHELHQASVNCVEWAPCGFKLYAGDSDGKISIMQLAGKSWKTSIFAASQSAITAISVQPLPLGEVISEKQEENFYPRFATSSKDQVIRIWGHQNEVNYWEKSEIYNQKGEQITKTGYLMLNAYNIQKQTIRSILWRPCWGSLNESFNEIKIVYCSQEGSLKIVVFELDRKSSNYKCEKEYTVHEGEESVVRIAQSLTGNMINASISQKQESKTLVFTEVNCDEWEYSEAIE